MLNVNTKKKLSISPFPIVEDRCPLRVTGSNNPVGFWMHVYVMKTENEHIHSKHYDAI